MDIKSQNTKFLVKLSVVFKLSQSEKDTYLGLSKCSFDRINYYEYLTLKNSEIDACEIFLLEPIQNYANEFLFGNAPISFMKCIIKCKNDFYLTIDKNGYIISNATKENALVFAVDLTQSKLLYRLNYKYKSNKMMPRLPCGQPYFNTFKSLNGDMISNISVIDSTFLINNGLSFSYEFQRPNPEDLIIYQLQPEYFGGKNNEHLSRYQILKTKLNYVRDMGFNAIEFIPDSKHGSIEDLRELIREAHKFGLAVILFYGSYAYNLESYLGKLNVDGVRIDPALNVNSTSTGKYFIATYPPKETSNYDSSFWSDGYYALYKALDFEFHPEYGEPLSKLKYIIGKNFDFGRSYNQQCNLVKFFLGSYYECGFNYKKNFFTNHFGGRENPYARAKARLAWALNTLVLGNPLLFMGAECHMDKEYDWALVEDEISVSMREMVSDVNRMRLENKCLRGSEFQITHLDFDNKILAFKRWINGQNNTLLIVVNISNTKFQNSEYLVRTGLQQGQWHQIFCSQDSKYGGWSSLNNECMYSFVKDNEVFININIAAFGVSVFRLL